jgi:hypothetical protein
MSATQDEQAPAVKYAEAGAEAWRAAARHQLWASADHSDFYALAGHAITTLHALDDLCHLLREQVAGYAAGRAVYDDTCHTTPRERLAEAAAEIDATRSGLHWAQLAANRFWSAIGHIGVEAGP